MSCIFADAKFPSRTGTADDGKTQFAGARVCVWTGIPISLSPRFHQEPLTVISLSLSLSPGHAFSLCLLFWRGKGKKQKKKKKQMKKKSVKIRAGNGARRPTSDIDLDRTE